MKYNCMKYKFNHILDIKTNLFVCIPVVYKLIKLYVYIFYHNILYFLYPHKIYLNK